MSTNDIELLTKIIGTAIGLFTAACFLFQYSRANREKSVALSRELINALFSDTFSRSALRMLDWDDRLYEVPTVGRVKIDRSIVKQGLRVNSSMSFSEPEQYVRDCFERLYDQTEMFEHFIRRGLLDFEDLMPPLASYIKQIRSNREVHFAFLSTYEYQLTIAFFNRFPA